MGSNKLLCGQIADFVIEEVANALEYNVVQLDNLGI